MWPGCYSFRDELKLFAQWFKEQTDSLILKIYELDRMLNSQFFLVYNACALSMVSNKG